MAGYDNGSGWAMIIESLNNFQKQTDPYNTMDLGKTLANLFRRNKKPKGDLVEDPESEGQKFVLSDSSNPDSGGYLTAQDVVTPTEAPQGKMVVPGGTQAHDPRSDYSADNPYLKWLGNPDSKIVRRMTPELQAALNKFEADKKETNLGQQLSELRVKSAKNQLEESGRDDIVLDEATISQLPQQIQFMFQPGQTVSRGEIAKLIPAPQTNKPGYITISESIYKAIPKQYQPFYAVGQTVSQDDLTQLIPKPEKPEKPDKTKDELLIPITTLANVKDENKDGLARQYSQAIRSNINDRAKVQAYIDRYNLLTGQKFTYDQWKAETNKKPVNRQSTTSKEPYYDPKTKKVVIPK